MIWPLSVNNSGNLSSKYPEGQIEDQDTNNDRKCSCKAGDLSEGSHRIEKEDVQND